MRPPNLGEVEALARFESELAGLRAARLNEHPWPASAWGCDPAPTARRAMTEEGGEDLDLLLGAIKARLRIAAASSAQRRPQGGTGADGPLILECVDALDLLQMMLRQKLAQRAAAVPAVSGRGLAGSSGPPSAPPRPSATAPVGGAPPADWVIRDASGSRR